jgi:tRNA (uracil-5-)-methyltransferase
MDQANVINETDSSTVIQRKESANGIEKPSDLEITRNDESDLKKDEVYQYLDRDSNTCEQFKIEIKNLPKYASYSTVKKLLINHIKVKPQKIKLIGNPVKFAFVAFVTQGEKEKALEGLNGYEWKSKKLIAVTAAPKQDPFVVNCQSKRPLEGEEEKDKRLKGDTIDYSIMDPVELKKKLNDQVCCNWRIPYEEQLKNRNQENNHFLTTLRKDILKMINNSQREPGIDGSQESKDKLLEWFLNEKKTDNPCSEIKAAPVINGYRNKCEFSLGVQDKVIGFRLGAYKDGLLKVVCVDEVPIVSDEVKKLVFRLQGFYQKDSLMTPFDPKTNTGHVKQIMIRSNQAKKHMITVTLDVFGVDEETLEKEKENIVASLEGSCVSSLFFEFVSRGDRKQKDDRLFHVFGEKTLMETMTIKEKEFRFSISPMAFFQINTKAAEVCYETIADLFEGNLSMENTLLLDICCGTGTIGISLASSVKKVIGIELSKEAVEDARVNARINGVTNIDFVCGRAEETLHKILNQNHSFSDIIAVIDPPRAGLNASVMKAIRSVTKVSKLVYVSCDAKFAKQNLIDLSRPVSKVYRGDPFVFKRVESIDMFPHTNRCELLFLFERLS